MRYLLKFLSVLLIVLFFPLSLVFVAYYPSEELTKNIFKNDVSILWNYFHGESFTFK
ncbi:MAG TPA: hypothetical protein VI112_08425 [Bacteroidia bacterium]